LTKDFIISSNHFFVFLIFGLIAFIAFSKEKKIIITYVFFISIFLEIMHFFIPIRAFEIKDLFGNLIGVIISLIIFNSFNFWRKKYGLF
jgi:VanZ family protein